MSELIAYFLSHYLHEELVIEIKRSFDLFDKYQYQNIETDLIDILNEHGQITNETLIDKFIAKLNEKLDFVLMQHSIKVIDGTSIYDKNELLDAFWQVQILEDYTGIISLLESLESDEEIFSLIISELCSLDQHKVLEIIESFNPRILKLLKEYIYKKEEEIVDTTKNDNLAINKNISLLASYLGNEGLGQSLITNNILVGCTFETYLPYFEEGLVVNSDVITAKNFYYLLSISSDGYVAPMPVFQQYSLQVIKELNKVGRVEAELSRLIGGFTAFREASYEKDRLSKASY